MIEAMQRVVEKMTLGDVQTYRSVDVFPITGIENVGLDYITLGEALEARVLTVAELNQGGSVPELKVVNTGEKPILLLDGEELAGAKQNRVLNTSVLVPGNGTMVIPVSCTEQGRWNYTSDTFYDSGTVMSREARARKVRSVSRSLHESASYRSDQGEVWNSIAELQEAAGVASPTMSMRDVFEARKDEIEAACKAIPVIAGQTGLLVIIGGKVAGLDMLSSANAYSLLHEKLVKSYVMEATAEMSPKDKTGDSVKKQAAAEFLASLPPCQERKFKSAGLGDDYRYKAATIVGSALVHQDGVPHASFFVLEPDKKNIRMTTLSRRRKFKLY